MSENEKPTFKFLSFVVPMETWEALGWVAAATTARTRKKTSKSAMARQILNEWATKRRAR